MSFREWIGSLRNLRGNHPHWPTLLGLVLDQVFQNQRTIPKGYQEEVFIDRDNEVPHERQDEKWLVKTLYRYCLTNHEGLLRLGDEEILLLGWEWPTQGGNAERGCRADLVGMTREGGLVFFECKNEGNGDPPLDGPDRRTRLSGLPDENLQLTGSFQLPEDSGRVSPMENQWGENSSEQLSGSCSPPRYHSDVGRDGSAIIFRDIRPKQSGIRLAGSARQTTSVHVASASRICDLRL